MDYTDFLTTDFTDCTDGWDGLSWFRSSAKSAVFNIGERPAKLAEVDEYARAVKGLIAGQTVRYRGKELVLRWGTENAAPVTPREKLRTCCARPM